MVAMVNDGLRKSHHTHHDSRHHQRRHRSALYELGAAVVATLARWQQRARERDELAHLDWRELKDVGLTSAEVQMLVDKPFWRA